MLCRQEAVAVKTPVMRQVSSESSGGKRQADKMLIAAKAQQPYVFFIEPLAFWLSHTQTMIHCQQELQPGEEETVGLAWFLWCVITAERMYA